MNSLCIVAILLVIGAVKADENAFVKVRGILINDYTNGPQFYDPLGNPAAGNVSLGLLTSGYSASAVVLGTNAYFLSTQNSSTVIFNMQLQTTRFGPPVTVGSSVGASNMYTFLTAIPSKETIIACTMLGYSNGDLCKRLRNGIFSHFPGYMSGYFMSSAPMKLVTINGSTPYLFGANDFNNYPLGAVAKSVYSFENALEDYPSADWMLHSPAPFSMEKYGIVVLKDHITVLVCGGNWNSSYYAMADLCFGYVSTTDTWSAWPKLNIARMSAGMAVYQGSAYIFGGTNAKGQAEKTVEILTEQHGWEVMPHELAAPLSTYSHASIVIE